LLQGNGKIASEDAHLLADAFKEVAQEQAPLMQEDEYQDAVGRRVKYRQTLLPFGKPDGTVDSILGGAWFKIA
jgi:hypothetical protein